MYRYDQNTGGFPKIGDLVEVVHSGDEHVDGSIGCIGGWGDHDGVIALVLLDKPLSDGRTIIGWPVVCLREITQDKPGEKWQRALDDAAISYEDIVHGDKVFDGVMNDKDIGRYFGSFGNLCSETEPTEILPIHRDSDGYIIWKGNADRPVSDDTLIQVKLRDGTIREIRDAGFWYQCHWQHFKGSEDMKKWDIVAYKVVK